MNSGTPKVSVCVVTYNHERYIEDCLTSLLTQQTDFDFEVIVGDDCSTDATSSIVNRFARSDSRVQVLRPERNLGASQNLLAVHNAARGAYVAHLDGDDLALPGKLAKLAGVLDSNPKLALCGHRMQIIDDHGQVRGVYPARLSFTFNIRKLVRCGMPIFASSIMYRAQARTLRICDFELFDWYFYTDVLRQGDAGFIPEVLGDYRVNPTSMTADLAVAGMVFRMLRLYERRFEEMPQYRGAFFAWGLLAAWTCFRSAAPISRDHWSFLRRTFAPWAIGDLVDAALWTLQNREAMAR